MPEHFAPRSGGFSKLAGACAGNSFYAWREHNEHDSGRISHRKLVGSVCLNERVCRALIARNVWLWRSAQPWQIG
jgi:hypothetical protein